MGRSERREVGVSTEPGDTYMDKVQDSVQEHGEGPEGEQMFVNASAQDASDADSSQPEEQIKRHEAELDTDSLQIIEQDDYEQPIQVENPLVVFVPMKDFEARVNQQSWTFQKGVPKHVDRELANMLVEDEARGYVRD